MDPTYDIPDPTDWHSTALSTFGPIDAALRCQVCKDFFNTAVITSCAHTFCSLCIRRCLAADGKCPACRTSEQEIRLRKNNTVQEITDAFVQARPGTLKVARDKNVVDESTSTTKRKREDTEEEDQRIDHGRQTRSSKRRATKQSPTVEKPTSIDDTEDEDDKDFNDGLVPCPLCNKRMKEEAVFLHLDRCDEEAEQKKSLTSKSKPRSSRTTTPQQPSQPPPERLPQLNFSLLKDAALRKKFAELGIPSWGAKPLLIRRHTEWINLWNANCDSTRPRSRRELTRDLDVWERTQGGHAPDNGGGQSAVMRKDFDGAGWAKQNKSNFDELIASAKVKRTTPAAAEQIDRDRGKQNGTIPSSVELPVEATSTNGTIPVSIPVPEPRSTRKTLPSLPSSTAQQLHPPVQNATYHIPHKSSPANSEDKEMPNSQPSNPTSLANTPDQTQHSTTVLEPTSRIWLPGGTPRKLPMFVLPTESIMDSDAGEVR